MIIVCPECSKRYMVSDAAIGEEGRMVRCVHCTHEWFQDPPKQRAPRVYQDDMPDLDFGGEDDNNFEDDIPDAVKPYPDEEEASAKPQKEKKPRGPVPPWQPLAGGYVVALAVLVLIGAAFFGLKGTILKSWPASALIYETLGSKVVVPGEGLTFDRVVAKAEKTSMGQNVLKLNGTVINLTREAVSVPPIMASLFSEGEELLAQWLIDLGVTEVEPEAVIPFEVTYPLQDKSFASVNLTFLAKMPKKEKAAPAETQEEGAHEQEHAPAPIPAEEMHEGDTHEEPHAPEHH
jgi:predicted Zn finger-like uncharacterized protein